MRTAPRVLLRAHVRTSVVDARPAQRVRMRMRMLHASAISILVASTGHGHGHASALVSGFVRATGVRGRC